MPTLPLPDDPSFEHLRKEAKRLVKAVHAGEPSALARVREFHPRAEPAVADFKLSDAQLVTAHLYGFASWARLKRHLDTIEPLVWNPPGASPPPDAFADRFAQLACLTYAASDPDSRRAFQLLAEHPEIVSDNIYTAAAAGDVSIVHAAIERDPAIVNRKGGPLQWEPLLYACYSRMDAPGRSTVDVARLLLSGGANPNAGFLFGGRYAFTALTGVFGRGEDWNNQPPHPHEVELARLLLEAGADPNDSQALYNRHFQESDDHLK